MASSWEMDKKWSRTPHEKISLDLSVRVQGNPSELAIVAQIQAFISELDVKLSESDSLHVSLTQTNVQPDITQDYPSDTEIISYGISKVGIPIESFTAREREAYVLAKEAEDSTEDES